METLQLAFQLPLLICRIGTWETEEGSGLNVVVEAEVSTLTVAIRMGRC